MRPCSFQLAPTTMARCVLSLCALLVGLGLVKGDGVKFNCSALPPLTQPARTVHELKPQDIKVVMALGDSITAGFGMMGNHGLRVWDDLDEYRGNSFSIGGDSNAQTLATFLRFYTPDIIGSSVGNHTLEICYGVLCPPLQYEPKKDVFNAAQSGAMITNVVKHELSYLTTQVKENKEVDMEKDWKLLTLLIGANDLCIACLGIFPRLTPDEYELHLNETLTEIKKYFPRTFVNLVLMGNISQIYELSLKSKYCETVHRLVPIECACAFTGGKEGEKLRKEMDTLSQEYNERTRKVAAWWAEQDYDDFAAIPQPFFSEMRADNLTIDFLSSLDCFHPSLLAHQNMAKALWNNMLTPAAKKKTFTEKFVCPTNTSIFYTN